MLPDVLVQIGTFSISTLGAFLAFAFLVGLFLFWRRGRQEGFSSDDLLDSALISSLIGLIGGRITFLVFFGSFNSVLDIVRVRDGTLWFGVLIFGFLALFLISRIKNWAFLEIGDIAAPSLAFGQSIGFLGAEILDYIPFGFYPALGYLVVWLTLRFLRRKAPAGTSFFSYLFFSGGLVYLAEWLRPQKAVLGSVNINYVFAAALAVLGFAGIFFLIAKKRLFGVKISVNGKE